MTNPFEEKRKNDRINKLVKERDELLNIRLENEKEINRLKLVNHGMEAVCAAYDVLKKQNETLFRDGYNQAVWDVTHFLTDKQKEVNND